LADAFGKELASARIDFIKKHCFSIWKKGELWHPEYTLHGPDHSEAVIRKLIKMTYEFMKTRYRLNKEEIFVLLASAWLHDIGMLIKEPGEEPELVRRTHNIRTFNYLQEKQNQIALGLNDTQAKYISLICKGHTDTDLHTVEYSKDGQIGDDRIRTGLLTALLKFADELDLDFNRAPEPLRKILGSNLPPYSLLQWLKHHFVEGVDFRIEQAIGGNKRLMVEIKVRIPHKKYYDLIVRQLIMNKLRETLSDVELILLRGMMTPISEIRDICCVDTSLDKYLDHSLSSIIRGAMATSMRFKVYVSMTFDNDLFLKHIEEAFARAGLNFTVNLSKDVGFDVSDATSSIRESDIIILDFTSEKVPNHEHGGSILNNRMAIEYGIAFGSGKLDTTLLFCRKSYAGYLPDYVSKSVHVYSEEDLLENKIGRTIGVLVTRLLQKRGMP
jgi:hypothetical protein